MLKDWETRFPGRVENMFTSLQNVVPSHLMDTKLYPFTTLQTTGIADEEGDKAFDADPLPSPEAIKWPGLGAIAVQASEL